MLSSFLESQDSERGFLTILGCCMLVTLVFCGMTLTYLTRNEIASMKRIQAEVRLYHAAKSAMNQAVISLEEKHIADASEKFRVTTQILNHEFSDGIRVQVFAKEKSGALLLMTRAEINDLDGWPAYQALYGYMKKESDYYAWAGYFEQDE